MKSIADQIVGDFKNLSQESQFEIFATISRILANDNLKLIEAFVEQLKEEQKGDWWDELTEEQQQNLLQQQREADAGTLETISHEQVQRKARE